MEDRNELTGEELRKFLTEIGCHPEHYIHISTENNIWELTHIRTVDGLVSATAQLDVTENSRREKLKFIVTNLLRDHCSWANIPVIADSEDEEE